MSKHHLDVALYPDKQTGRFTNSEAGIAELIEWLASYQVDLVAAEATGGLELPLLISIYEAGLSVARLNPRWVKDFARAQGKRAKTDLFDALLIAHYAAVMEPDPWQPLDEDGWTFKDLAARRRQLITMVTMETNRSYRSQNAHVTRQHLRLIAVLKHQVEEIETVLQSMIERTDVYRKKAKLICSVPGLAHTTAATLIAELPELGQLTSKQIASLAGLAPFTQQSGQYAGKARIFAGRNSVRKCLYMVAVGMTRRNNAHFRAFYDRLVEAGKPKKVALIALMRKLIVTLNAMIKHKTAWRNPISTTS